MTRPGDGSTLQSGASPDEERDAPRGNQSGTRYTDANLPSNLPEVGALIRTTPVLDSERFEQRERLGEGGSGYVFRAFDRDLQRTVAIKILKAEPGDGGLDVERFTEEARVTGQLEHPNIAPVYDYAVDGRGQRFLCMKLVDGRTLESVIEELDAARLDPEHLAEFLKVFVKVCEAVSFAHSRGVLHRDLKPSNVMMSEFGQVHVLDWGIARRVRPSLPDDSASAQRDLDPPGALIGTHPYMAPEQIQGRHDDLDARTDVFSLGAVLYQVLTGRPPLTDDIVYAIRTRRSAPAIAPPESLAPPDRVPSELSRIALRALSYAPDARYPTVLDLKRDIDLFQRGSWDLPRAFYPAGKVIVVEGDPGNEAFIIAEGRCVAYRVEDAEEIQLRVMGPGEVFGETAVFSAKPRSASVKALTDVTLQIVTSQALSNSVGLNSWMGAFVAALANRFLELDERLRAKRAP